MLKIKCPRCKRGLHQLEELESATMVYDRKCRCGVIWRIICGPKINIKGGYTNKLEWTIIGIR